MPDRWLKGWFTTRSTLKGAATGCEIVSKGSVPFFGTDYQYRIILQNEPDLNSFERDLFRSFRKEPEERNEDQKPRPNEQVLVYSAPILAGKSCLTCHYHASVAERDLLGIMQIRMPTK